MDKSNGKILKFPERANEEAFKKCFDEPAGEDKKEEKRFNAAEWTFGILSNILRQRAVRRAEKNVDVAILKNEMRQIKFSWDLILKGLQEVMKELQKINERLDKLENEMKEIYIKFH
jgi:hypothetical protein